MIAFTDAVTNAKPRHRYHASARLFRRHFNWLVVGIEPPPLAIGPSGLICVPPPQGVPEQLLVRAGPVSLKVDDPFITSAVTPVPPLGPTK